MQNIGPVEWCALTSCSAFGPIFLQLGIGPRDVLVVECCLGLSNMKLMKSSFSRTTLETMPLPSVHQ